MKTVKEAQKAIYNRVAAALGKDGSKFIEILSSDPAAELPEDFGLNEEALSDLVTLDFVYSDKETWDKVHKRALGSTMPDIEKAQRKVVEDFIRANGKAFGNPKQLLDAYSDNKHERMNQRFWGLLEAVAEDVKAQVSQAGTAPEELKAKLTETQNRANELQIIVDEFDGKLSASLSAKEQEFQRQISEMALITKAKELGAKFPSERVATFWALDMLQKADFTREGGELKVFQKGTEAPPTDPKTKTTIKTDDFVRADLVDFIPRNNGDGEGNPNPKPPYKPGDSGGNNGYPEGIKPGTTAAAHWDLKQKRQAARQNAIAKP